MKSLTATLTREWIRLGPRFLPFADAGTRELPLSRLLRLALFQVSVGMAVVLLNGTLNRVTVVELGVPTWLVSLMVSLPLVFAPLRALIGFRSDYHRSALGWRRVPYIWFGTLLQFGGLALMPFALLLLSGNHEAPVWIGPTGAALAFLLLGAGLHVTQTAGLALATDLAPPEARPRASRSSSPGSKIGACPPFSFATRAASVSKAMTWWPQSARQAAPTTPWCQRPMTATFIREPRIARISRIYSTMRSTWHLPAWPKFTRSPSLSPEALR